MRMEYHPMIESSRFIQTCFNIWPSCCERWKTIPMFCPVPKLLGCSPGAPFPPLWRSLLGALVVAVVGVRANRRRSSGISVGGCLVGRRRVAAGSSVDGRRRRCEAPERRTGRPLRDGRRGVRWAAGVRVVIGQWAAVVAGRWGALAAWQSSILMHRQCDASAIGHLH